MADSGGAERSAAAIRAARALGDSRNFRAAADTLQQVLGRDPDNVEAHYLFGLYLYDLGRHRDAIAACRTAVRLDPENAVAHRLLGIVLGAFAATKAEGLRHLDHAVRLSPTDGFNHYFRARSLTGLARPRQALAAYLAACDRAPDEPFILAGTAHFLFSTYKVRKAQGFAARAFAASPEDVGALTAEARSRLIDGHTADALDLARAAVAIEATSKTAIEILIEARMRSNPLFAVWSRLKSWCGRGSWRRSVLLIGMAWALIAIEAAVAMSIPDVPGLSLLIFVACYLVAASPNFVFQRRVARALRPVRLAKRF